MKNIFIAAAIIAAAYGAKKLYDLSKSATILDVEIIDLDISKATVKIRFINAGNGPIKVDSFIGSIYANQTKVATVSNLQGFVVAAKSEKEVSFDLKTSVSSVFQGLFEALKGQKPVFMLDCNINTKGIIINKKITF